MEFFKDLVLKFKVGFKMLYETGLDLYCRYGFLYLLVIIGLLVTGDIATIFVILKVLSILSVFLIVCSMALDDRKNKGLFPDYDEAKLISLTEKSPIASAIVIFSKNLLMAIILVMAFLFIAP